MRLALARDCARSCRASVLSRRERCAQAKLRRMSALDKAGLGQHLRYVHVCSVKQKKVIVTDMKTRSAVIENKLRMTDGSSSGYVFLCWVASGILRIPEEAGY